MDKEKEQIQAAYALNLCTVSVSQIIDYNDLNILEQEYDAILNNLNLENMPDDEALLNILKQLLDTITFFRITDAEKEMLEKKYSRKMKNAIWNAVPNVGIILASGNPLVMAASLASQIGSGYMNYRKAKAELKLSQEDEEWELQRAAIEQFNGLRRELFDTAWRLAKRYKFEDKLRLTEKQIKQYNDILLDNDIVRKYQRLEAIQMHFSAYPPFWYFFGNTANEISRNNEICETKEIAERYRQLAESHFERYWQENQYELLREDYLASSCALEYVDIMIDNGAERSKIVELINKARQFSGNSCDILQMCAIAYIRLDCMDEAHSVLKYLVNENYNVPVNVQLLSGILIRLFNESHDRLLYNEYTVLERRNDQKRHLIPWPENGTVDDSYLDIQRSLLIDEYNFVLKELIDRYDIIFNSLLPIPDEYKEYENKYFSRLGLNKRIREIKAVFAMNETKESYMRRLKNSNFAFRYIDVLNELFQKLNSISFIDLTSAQKIIKVYIKSNYDILKDEFDEFDEKKYEKIQEFLSIDNLKKVFSHVKYQTEQKVKTAMNMADISQLENELLDFCNKNDISMDKFNLNTKNTDSIANDDLFFAYDLLGQGAFRINQMIKIIRDKQEVISKYKNRKFYISGTDELSEYLKNNEKIKKYSKESDVLAILDSKNIDLIFTTDYVIYFVKGKELHQFNYDNIKYDEVKKEFIFEDETSDVELQEALSSKSITKLLKPKNTADSFVDSECIVPYSLEKNDDPAELWNMIRQLAEMS